VAGTLNGTLLLIDAERGAILHEFAARRDEITSLSCSQDGRLLAVGSQDQTVSFWQIGDDRLELLWQFPLHAEVVKAEFFDNDRKLAVLLQGEGGVRVLNLALPLDRLRHYGVPLDFPFLQSTPDASSPSVPTQSSQEDPLSLARLPKIREVHHENTSTLFRLAANWGSRHGYVFVLPLELDWEQHKGTHLKAIALKSGSGEVIQIPEQELPPKFDRPRLFGNQESIYRSAAWGFQQFPPCRVFPNFQNGIDSNRKYYGALKFNADAVELRQINRTELLEHRSTTLAADMLALQKYAAEHGFLAAFPTYRIHDYPGDPRIEAILIKKGFAEQILIPAEELR